MIHRILGLAFSILLSLAPVVAAGPQQQGQGAQARPAGGPARTAPAATLIDRLSAAGTNPAGLRSLAVETGAAADFVKAAVSDPRLLADSAVRAQAEAALGPTAVAELSRQSQYWSARAENDAEAASLINRFSAQSTDEKTRKALASIVHSETAAWVSAEAEGVAAAEPASKRAGSSLSKPRRGMRAVTSALAVAMTLGAASPAFTAPAAHVAPAVMRDAGQAKLMRVSQLAGTVSASDITDASAKFDPNAQIYLISNPDISDSALRRLLSEIKGKPVVVVIVGDATGNAYKGRKGADAVDWWVGEDLYARGGVTDAKNAVTGERAGVVVTIMQKARQVNGEWKGRVLFRPSDALKSQGLLVTKKSKDSDKTWESDYQNVFMQKYRAGNDYVGAITATLSALERDLGDRLKAAESQGANALVAARSAVESLAAAKSQLASKNSKAVASIGASADLPAMQRALGEAEALIKQGRHGAAAAVVAGIPAKAAQAVSEINEYLAGSTKLADAAKRLKAVSGMDSASAASKLLTEAGQDLRAAGEAHNDGKAVWSSKLASAKSKTDSAEKIIVEAQKTAERNFMLQLGMLLGLLLTGGLAGFYMNRRFARHLRAATLQALAPWDAKFAAMDNAVIDNVDAWLMKNLERKWTGRTMETIKQMQSEAGAADLRRKAMVKAYEKASALVHPPVYMLHRHLFNAIWPAKMLGLESNYVIAEKLMTETPIEVSLESRKTDWKDAYYGSIDNFKPVTKTFPELVESHDTHAAAAVAAKETVENARAQAATMAADMAQAMQSTSELKAKIQNADGLFQASALFDAALPAAEAKAASVKELKDSDPVGALEQGGAEAARIAREVRSLAETIAAARSGSLVKAQAAAERLRAGSYSADWIESDKNQLSANADEIAAAMAEAGVADRIAALGDDLSKLAQYAEDAAAGAEALSAEMLRITAVDRTIEPARQKMSEATGIAADKLLKEANANPDEAIKQARAASETARGFINDGEIEKARAAYSETKNALDAAEGLVAAGLKIVDGFQNSSQSLDAETKRIEGLVPEAKSALDALRDQYAPSAMKLDAGDKTHPNSNGTIEDNVDEIEAALKAAAEKRAAAAAAFKKGQFIKADQILQQIEAHQKMALDRIDEIHEKAARLQAQALENEAAKKALADRVSEGERTIVDEGRSQNATLEAFEGAKKLASKAAKMAGMKKGDPFQAADALKGANAALEQAYTLLAGDIALHGSAVKAVNDAYAALGQADTLYKDVIRAQGETDLALQAKTIVDELGDIYETAAGKLNVDSAGRLTLPHGDWKEVLDEANHVSVESARVSAMLKDELAQADEAGSLTVAAGAQVQEAIQAVVRLTPVDPRAALSADELLGQAKAALDGAHEEMRRGRYQASKDASQAAIDRAMETIRYVDGVFAAIRAAEIEAARQAAEELRRRQEEEAELRRRSDQGQTYGQDGDYGRNQPGQNNDGWNRPAPQPEPQQPADEPATTGNDGSDLPAPKKSESGNVGSDL